MPSQIFHSIFAEELIGRIDPSFDRRALSPLLDSAILLGAQGPDIFFHNRRTKPSGLGIGAVLHTKGYGSLSALMLEHCLRRNKDERSPEGLYLLAFISHAVLDRHFHPFVNYFAGWVSEGEPDSLRYRHCHPFFERILDEAVALRFRSEDVGAERVHRQGAGDAARKDGGAERGAGGAEQPERAQGAGAQAGLNFAERFAWKERMHSGIRDMLLRGLRLCFRRMAEDPLLEERVDNAYTDAVGFYRHSEQGWGAGAAQRGGAESAGGHRGAKLGGTAGAGRGSARGEAEIPLRWAALVHPLYLPADIDFLNAGKREWCDPMDSGLRYSDSLWDVYERAFEAGRALLSVVYDVLKGGAPPSDYPGLAVALGDYGLRTTIASDKQLLVHSEPLPLGRVIREIAGGVDVGGAGAAGSAGADSGAGEAQLREGWLPWQEVLG